MAKEMLCPVCNKHLFTEPFETCSICGWVNDVYQHEKPDSKRCANFMSLNEAKEAYKKGEEIW